MADSTHVPPPLRINSSLSSSSPTSPTRGINRVSTTASVIQLTLAARNADRAERRLKEREARDQVQELLKANSQGKIDNPLRRLSVPQLYDRVDARLQRWGFSQNPEMGDAKMWKRAARCAADPDSSIYVPDLTTGERKVLRKEEDPRTSFWDETNVRVPIALCCLAAMIQGVAQSSANAANLFYPEALGMAAANGEFTSTGTQWLFNAQNAAPLLSGAIFGCWLSDPLNEFLYGRRGAIFIAGIVTLVSVIGAAFSSNRWVLLAFRILLGLGMGSKASVVPIYAAEISPPKLRGRLLVNWQVFDALGIAFAFTLNMIFARDERSGWRLMFAEGLLPTLPMLALVFAVPESPRFLMKRGLYIEAYRSLLRLRGHPIRAAKEMFYLDAQLEAAEAEVMLTKKRKKAKTDEERNASSSNHASTGGVFDDEDDDVFGDEKGAADTDPDLDEPDYDPSGFWPRLSAWWDRLWKGGVPIPGRMDPFVELFRQTTYWTRIQNLVSHPRVARASFAAAIVMISQQFCGINILAFYSSSLFLPQKNEPGDATPISNDSKYKALYFSWGFGMTNFVFSIFAYYFVDKKGRRWILLATFPFMAILLLLAGFTYDPVAGLSYAFVLVFTAVYSIGGGPIPFTYSAEVFPLANREAGMSLSVFWNFLFAGLLQLLVPQLFPSPVKLLGVFAALCIVAWLFIFFFVRETKERTLEEINYIFGVTTIRHIKYQVYEVAPCKFRLLRWWIMSRDESTKPTEPPPLYTWYE